MSTINLKGFVDDRIIDPVEDIIDEIEAYNSVGGMLKLLFFKQTSPSLCSFICTYEDVNLINITVSKILSYFAFDDCEEPSYIYIIIIVNVVYIILFLFYFWIAMVLYKDFKPLIKLILHWITVSIENTFIQLENVAHKAMRQIKKYENIYTKHIEHKLEMPMHNKTK